MTAQEHQPFEISNENDLPLGVAGSSKFVEGKGFRLILEQRYAYSCKEVGSITTSRAIFLQTLFRAQFWPICRTQGSGRDNRQPDHHANLQETYIHAG